MTKQNQVEFTLQRVMEAFLTKTTPIAANDPGWNGLEGQGYLTELDAEHFAVMDVCEDSSVAIQVYDGSPNMLQAWELKIEVKEVM